MSDGSMHNHRMIGAGLALLGLAVLFGQFALLYGSAADQALMVSIGLPGVAIASAAGAVCFGCGCLLAAAPRAAARHARRISEALRRRGR